MTTLAGPSAPAAMPQAVNGAASPSRTAFDWIPSLIAASVYFAVSAAILIAGYRLASHHWVYPLDDTYIGMAMAKNLALHGVWGVTPYGFTSSDSPILLPLLLAAADRLFGVHPIAPIAISWLAGLACIFVAGRMLQRFLDRTSQIAVLLLFVLLAPVYVAGLLGMEHSLHLLFTLLFLEYFLDPGRTRRSLRSLGLVTALMVASRYEGLFFVAPAFCLLAFERRWKPALTIATAAAIPVLGYAAFSIANGGYWLPNSVAVKGAQMHHRSLLQPVHDILRVLAGNYAEMGLQLFLIVAAAGLASLVLLRPGRRQSTLWHSRLCSAAPLLLVFIAGVEHLCLARIGVLFRYEIYLTGAAIVCLGCAAPALARARNPFAVFGVWALVLASGALLTVRSIASGTLLPSCSRNIYLQQWQMARFLARNFPHATVAANDIGAIDYFNDLHCYDLVGLANADIFRARRAGRYTTQFLAQDTAAAHVPIAILYDSWFADPPPGTSGGPALPSSWIRVARWTIPDNHAILGENTVSFYAVDPDYAGSLRAALARFDPTLPPGARANMNP